MGCSSCSTSDGGSAPGCKNNGTCGTGGCNKLNVYNWLADMHMPEGYQPFNVVEVRFKGSRKEFFRNSENVELKTGDVVAVEGNPGHDIGTVSLSGELVRLQLKAHGLNENSDQIKALYRLARPADVEKWESVKALEFQTMHSARSIALKLNLKMKLSDVEYQGDGKKATFYYTADERVDFRELIKKLADEFKTRIEMRQIGMRQEASRLGGIGSCGRELCCSTWLTDFKIVSTSAARYQNLSLNPIKLAGQCGKLKCCLNYELDSYIEAVKDIPDSSTILETAKGPASHRKTDIFKRMMWFAYNEPGSGANSDNWIMLHVDRVKEVIALNKNGEKPADLSSYTDFVPEEKKMDYADVVGQDSLTRMMDSRKKKKKKKKGGSEQRTSQNTTSQQPVRTERKENQQQRSSQSNKPVGSKPQQEHKTQEGNRRPERSNPAKPPSAPAPSPTKVNAPAEPKPASSSPITGGRVRQSPPRTGPSDNN